MIRLISFLLLAGALVAWASWIYLRVELAVPAARRLAVVRSAILVVLLTLLFDPRLPATAGSGSPRWVLLDASLSMMAGEASGASAWAAASARAETLGAEGWNVVRFGAGTLEPYAPGAAPDRLGSRLGPALAAAAESGAREVVVLSDFRLEDVVGLRAALETLPVDVSFEPFGAAVPNAGISRFAVPDLPQPDGRPVAELELHGGRIGDSVSVEILEEDRVVATTRVAAPSAGLRAATAVELPTPAGAGRVRYEARVAMADDGFAPDDRSVAYANVGHPEGALVLVSARPDWEPRYLLPVLEEVTGLTAVGYLRAGADRWVRLGRAIERGPPADSAAVRRAAADASILVVHGLAADSDGWLRDVTARPGRRLLLPADAAGARTVGLEVSAPRDGEWYASPDVPTSPLAGALAGISLGGLPPLTGVLVPNVPIAQPPLQVQLRGAGAPESALALLSRAEGRVAVALASGTWRWAARDGGREPYRRFWSGVAGWLLADRSVIASEPRPASWVVERGAPVRWSLPDDSTVARIVAVGADGVALDTTVTGREASTGPLAAGTYNYAVTAEAGDTLAVGRFDVSASTAEMLPAVAVPVVPERVATLGALRGESGRPLRTSPWPYLLVIVLLCAEWIVRRRSGLR